MKKILCLLLAMFMLFALAACSATEAAPEASQAPAESETPAAAEGDVYTVSLQLTFPEGSAGGIQSVMDKIEEESNGRIKFEVYYSYSLVGNTDVVDALKDGTLDIAGFMPSEFPGLFVLNGTLMGLPFMGFPSEEAATEIYYDLTTTDEDFMAEFDNAGIKYWSSYVCPPYQLYLTKDFAAAATPDFTGLTIMTENALLQSMISSCGGAAMASIPPDYYSNMSNGVADAVINHLPCVNAFGCVELTKTALYFGDGGFCCYPLCYGISPTFWDSLPEDLQAIFTKYTKEVSTASLASDVAQVEALTPALEETASVVYLTDDEISGWKDAFTQVRDGALTDMTAANPAATEAYNTLTEKIANYGK